MEALGSFPLEYQDYFSRGFGFRLSLIQGRSIVRNKFVPMTRGLRSDLVTARDNTPRYVQGNDSWFFLDRNGMFFDHMGLDPLSEKRLDELEDKFEKRQQWFREQGIYYLLVIAPDKQSIYPEHLPAHLANRRGKTRLDQVMERMDDPSRVNMLDLRPAMIAAKEHGPLYYHNDAHWNELGAYFAYKAILDRISLDYPNLRPEPLEAFDIQWLRDPSHEELDGSPFPQFMTQSRGIGRWFPEEYVRLNPREKRKALFVTEDSSPMVPGPWGEMVPFVPDTTTVRETSNFRLPRALIFHDSFMRTYLETFLSEHFERSAFYWKSVV